ncbi:type IX secretion system membrane protein PorP/SprF [Polaribacter aestuariivivens]|uniref:Type IX secretion system membrane protein PorP/SprF n=1 Tax=Polaribacter aestuariivivens TaxID=2304626 RepID=A0A5S3N3G4_9FLAO|nr:PorP/SprF family type IX secretion system membrane protein [Polaribacter aestuariivivens]TMM29898.1 type IX secretion system membrane protein PorP/SprF [Polaribacter aestuariivivens]
MFKPPIYIVVLLFCVTAIFSQNTQEELYNNFSSHNFLKSNRFFLNPTFSVARENATYLSFLSRNKFSDFDDSPQLYVGSYSGRISEKIGVGLGVFQQNFGIFKNFGVLLNYAYQVKLSQKNALAFGFNFMYSRNGIDRSKIVVTNPDPFISNFQERPIINFQPAVNITLGSFDMGIFLENLFDYDLKDYEFITPFSEKTISGHLMYTKPFANSEGLLKDGKIQFLNIVKKPGKNKLTYTTSLLLDLPKIGWIQSTYDDFYGTSLGIGFNISERISIGFVYEQGKNNLGITNEIGLTYNFGKQDYVTIKDDSSFKNKLSTTKKSAQTNQEVNDKNQKDVYKMIDAYKAKQDSINALQQKEAQKKHLQLLKLIKSNQQNTAVEIISNKPKDTIQRNVKSFTSKKERTTIPKKKLEKDLTQNKVSDGYYVVANYFSIKNNAINFLNTLKSKGFNASYFKHPNKNNYYVYLGSFKTNNEAQNMVASKFNNRYKKLLSIVKVNQDRVGVIPLNNLSTTLIKNKKPIKAKQITVKKPSKKGITTKPIRIRKLKSNNTIQTGYYLIVNVFSKKFYANKFIEKLKRKGLNPKFFINKKNNYRYVYLDRKTSKKEITELYHSNLNGNYTEDKWILYVE